MALTNGIYLCVPVPVHKKHKNIDCDRVYQLMVAEYCTTPISEHHCKGYDQGMSHPMQRLLWQRRQAKRMQIASYYSSCPSLTAVCSSLWHPLYRRHCEQQSLIVLQIGLWFQNSFRIHTAILLIQVFRHIDYLVQLGSLIYTLQLRFQMPQAMVHLCLMCCWLLACSFSSLIGWL